MYATILILQVRGHRITTSGDNEFSVANIRVLSQNSKGAMSNVGKTDFLQFINTSDIVFNS